MATFRKLKSGKWQAAIRKKGEAPLYKSFRTKAAAKDWAVKAENDAEFGAKQTTMTVGELIDWYERFFNLNEYENKRELSKTRTLKKYLSDAFVAKLTPAAIFEFAKKRLSGEFGKNGNPTSGGTVKKDIDQIKKIISAANQAGVISIINPTTDAKDLLKTAKLSIADNKRDRRPNDEELAEILKTPVFEFAIETAMRREEITKIKRQDISGNTLHIPEAKTGPRTIALSPRAIEILKAQPLRISGIVFPMRPNTLTQMFGKMRNKNGFVDLKFHDLRHEGTSRLFEAGLSIPEVASITGHADWESLQRYTQLSPEKVAENLASKLAEKLAAA